MSGESVSHAELKRLLLGEAILYLESTDLRRANEVFELAGEEISILRDVMILPEPRAPSSHESDSVYPIGGDDELLAEKDVRSRGADTNSSVPKAPP